jgi:DNA repair exonuclease SbcCD ATPase subunit
MKLRALRVRNVGPFGDEGCVLDGLSDGLNVVRESNEAGKTTLYRALKLILFDAYNSKKQHIKSLRCDRSTGGLYVELDLEIDGKTYRLVKQYLKGEMAAVIDLKTNRLIAESKDAEAWIADQLGSDKLETSSPGLLWIGQGESLVQPTSQAGAGRKLFDSLDGEIETVVGGDQANAVLEQAKTRLLDYLTVSGKPRAQLKDTMDEVERLRDDQQELADRVHQSEAERGELVEVEKKLNGLTEENEREHSKKLEDARKALNDANQTEQKVVGFRSTMEAAAANAAIAKAELDEFQDRLEALTDLQKNRATKNDEAATDRLQVDALEQDLKSDREQVAGLKQSYEDTKSAFAEAEKTSKKIEAISKRQSIENALAKAREITRKLTSAQQDVALKLPKRSAKALRFCSPVAASWPIMICGFPLRPPIAKAQKPPSQMRRNGSTHCSRRAVLRTWPPREGFMKSARPPSPPLNAWKTS